MNTSRDISNVLPGRFSLGKVEQLIASKKQGRFDVQMDNKKIHHFFKPSLFWDVDINNLDIDSHARFITERVINRGSITDWKMLLSLYGVDKVKSEALTIRSLDPRSLNFLSVYFNIPETDFRCCN